MKKQLFAVFAASVIALVGGTGCMVSQVTMQPGSILPSNVPVQQGKYTILNNGNVVSGKYKLNILHLSDNDYSGSAMKKAVDEALSQCPGANALVGITTDTMDTMKTLITPFGPIPREASRTFFVTGTPVKTND